MAELGVLLGGVLVAVLWALLERLSDPSVRVVRGSRHRDGVRRAIDRMRDAPACGPAGGASDGARGPGQGPPGGV
jgi:hypothetical protein